MCEVKIFHLHSGVVFQKKMQYNEITINLECLVFTGVSNFDLDELALLFARLVQKDFSLLVPVQSSLSVNKKFKNLRRYRLPSSFPPL